MQATPFHALGPSQNDKGNIHWALTWNTDLLLSDFVCGWTATRSTKTTTVSPLPRWPWATTNHFFFLSCFCKLFYHHSRKTKTSLIHNSLSLSFLHIAGHSQCWEVGQQVILREGVLSFTGYIHGFPKPTSCHTGVCSILQPCLADCRSHQPQKGKSTPWLQPKLTTVRVQ